jgi:hypothetical protein
MAKEAQAATGVWGLTAIADRGYFKSEEILACEAAGVTPLVPKPLTSNAKTDGRFGKPHPRDGMVGCGSVGRNWRKSGGCTPFNGIRDGDPRR